MIRPDWNIFSAKFSDNPQWNFEWMCYLLFCKEHGKETGIFRYFNQSAIETNPIEFEGKVIGWQARFYNTSLSAHKHELLQMLEMAKRDYPTIEKLFFYTNSEWGQYQGNEPAGKIKIEEKAKKLSIQIEWRCKSYFESSFVTESNKRVTSYFFQHSDNIFDCLDSLSSHTNAVLDRIETEIKFKNRRIVIDRSEILSEIEKISGKAVILSGDGGTGKTSVIKSLMLQKSSEAAFYVHKATEFSVSKIDDLLSGVSLGEFIDAHKGINTKILVIDSAEKLLDIDNLDPFGEYISTLFHDGWSIWLTTRSYFLEDLAYRLIDLNQLPVKRINLSRLSYEELNDFAEKFNFQLPQNRKLLDLIRIPIYFRYYLNHYQESKNLDGLEFKKSLWRNVIAQGVPQREQVFIELAVTRATSAGLFVPLNRTSLNNNILASLVQDGIIGYESPHGYFITHDVYEEWALEKHIESNFLASMSAAKFFDAIKETLPIRRAFRKWLSENLGDDCQEVILFLDDALDSNETSNLWSDEILISVLLSGEPEFFFNSNKGGLLHDNCSLLKKICMLIQLGCKEVDNNINELIGQAPQKSLTEKFVFTKPKGRGWKRLIEFIYKNYSSIGYKNFHFIFPVLYDWNKTNRIGATTKKSSLLALKYYERRSNEGIHLLSNAISEKLVLTILYGVKEISTELSNIFDEVSKKKWNKHNNPYYLLSEFTLSKMECFKVAYTLPQKVIDLAKLFWIDKPAEDDRFCRGSDLSEVYESFGIKRTAQTYTPSSSYQTPIYWLLQTKLEITLDFIVNFINSTTESYVSSSLADQDRVEEVLVHLDSENTVSQYISDRLWCAYRGTEVNPDIFESILMSLECFLLRYGKNATSENLEKILLYILSRTNSTALSALVTSVVLAFSEKTFKVASILFKTKEFFHFDLIRMVKDQSHKHLITTISFSINRLNELHNNERINACDEPHRKKSLEHVMLQYQFFRSDEISDAEANFRSEEIWKILDEYYQKLPATEDETESDKLWRLVLARVDKRKMSLDIKETNDGIRIEFNPEIDSELKEISENAKEEKSKPSKHIQLLLWSENRLNGRNDYKNYKKYESQPIMALNEAREIFSEILECENSESLQFNRSIPSVVCAVLLRDFPEILSKNDLKFCKEVTYLFGSLFLKNGYSYQIGDGVMPAQFALPYLVEYLPEEEENIKLLVILALMHEEPVNAQGTKSNSFLITGLQKLWRKDFKFVLSIFVGYIILAQKKKDLLKKIRKNNFENGQFDFDSEEFWKKFIKTNLHTFEKVFKETIIDQNINDIKNIDIKILSTAFQMIPLQSEMKIPYLEEIITKASEKILFHGRGGRPNFSVRQSFLEKFTQFVLHRKCSEIEYHLAPFLDNFVVSEGAANLLTEFINSQDQFCRPSQFWTVWELFGEKIVEAATNCNDQHYTNEIIESYMFARNSWKEDAEDWPAFTEERRTFFNDLTKKLGHNHSYLYSLAKLLAGLGSIYIQYGIFWLSTAIKTNEPVLTGNYRENTIFYLEQTVKKYILLNRGYVRRTPKAIDAVTVILDFLVSNGSATGYLLREDIV